MAVLGRSAGAERGQGLSAEFWRSWLSRMDGWIPCSGIEFIKEQNHHHMEFLAVVGC